MAVALGTVWALPAGLAIGLSPRLSRVLQPVVQVVASFPAPMLFPAVVAVLTAAGVGLGWGSVLLMLLGTQWYVLFNVVAGATAIPADLREAARLFRFGTWQRFRTLYLPAIFPYLVTGWVTAAGGAWNASIVSEYMSVGGDVLAARGLGATITIAAGALGLLHLLRQVDLLAGRGIAAAAGLTLARVLAATLLGTLWTLPAGLAIGLSPRLSRLLQPAVQVVASFPAPMLFPAVVAALTAAGIGLGWGSVVLMLLGTQWYILFNVIAGATAIPADLREAARMYRLGPAQRFRTLYFPAVFPYLVTGWITAAGGAWNASIVSEYMSFRGQVLSTNGLGARISLAAAAGDFAALAASIAVMAGVVVAFNRFVWRRLQREGEARFSVAR